MSESGRSGNIRVVICFPLVNPYMAACWRELASRNGIDLLVIGHRSSAGDLVAFAPDIMEGVPNELLVDGARDDLALTADLVAKAKPDVLIVSGWSHRPFRKLYFDDRLRAVKKVLVMDNQYRGDLRQRAGALILKQLMSRVDRLFVTGERSWQFARFLGVAENRIHRGAVSVDFRALSPLYDSRIAQPWPRRFLFAGRYHERKALDVLVEGYRIYRSISSDPWPLDTAGMGPMANLLEGREGISDLGFASPARMSGLWIESGVFVMPSRFDAWPLVIVEAAAAGLPIIATEKCGSTVEVVRDLYNGRTIPSDDPLSLATAMAWMHDNYAGLAAMGARSRELAAPYSAQVWADRVVDMVQSLLADRKAAAQCTS